MASGIPVYFLFIGWKNKPACIQKALGIVHALYDSVFINLMLIWLHNNLFRFFLFTHGSPI